MDEVKFVFFVVEGQVYCIELLRIDSIEQSYRIVPVPLGAQYVKGIIHLREHVIPVYDIKEVPKVVLTGDTGYAEFVIKVKLPGKTRDDIVISVDIDHIMSDEDFDAVQDALDEVEE